MLLGLVCQNVFGTDWMKPNVPYHIILYFTNGYLVFMPTKIVLPLVETVGCNLVTFLLTCAVSHIFLQIS